MKLGFGRLLVGQTRRCSMHYLVGKFHNLSRNAIAHRKPHHSLFAAIGQMLQNIGP
jgi:hypothetical protein